MNGPDGPEERTAFYEDHFEREDDEIDRIDDRADEAMDAVLMAHADRRIQQMVIDRILDGGVFV
jgi:hypothetical protein